ncbi:MAG: DNA phosphorothioation-associated putative methyltransferase [Pseudomonadota bacterium]
MLGKKVFNDTYWHHSLTFEQEISVQEKVQLAEELANLQAGKQYNIIKYTPYTDKLSLLNYPDFFDNAFPELAFSWRVDILTEKIEKRNYQNSLNPPILHRKELFLSLQHPRQAEYQALTKMAEELGIFAQQSEKKIQIGFKQPWYSLIHSIGYQVEGHQLIPIGNETDGLDKPVDLLNTNEVTDVKRHRTAISRGNLSAPVQFLARYGFLNGEYSVFDYGCGKGDDLCNLLENEIDAQGWDPHFAPDNEKKSCDLVNIGFVLNVIEEQQERYEALKGAFSLTNKLLVVSVMLYHQSSHKGERYKDGYISSRNTFQKYYSQSEIKEYIDQTLKADSIPVAPGIFFVFSDKDFEQSFLQNKQRSQSNFLRLVNRPGSVKLLSANKGKLRFSIREERKKELFELSLKSIDSLRIQWLQLGRQPDKSEVENLVTITEVFGTYNKAIQFLITNTDANILEQSRNNRIDDILTYLAFQTFTKRTAFSHMDKTLKRDIKVFFGDYKCATNLASELLYKLGDVSEVEGACIKAMEEGIGFYNGVNSFEKRSLHLPASLIDRLPALLRLYISCASILYGDVDPVDLIKIHVQSGKLSLMSFDNFTDSALPLLQERVKIDLRHQQFDVFEYGDEFEPTYLYLKSKYINEEFPWYAEQLAFDEKLQSLNIFDFSHYGPRPHEFRQKLINERLEIVNFELVNSHKIPSLDTMCGDNFTYQQLIECGETWKKTQIENVPKKADTYTSLFNLAKNIIDPVIDYFGMIELTYAFSSDKLAKAIPGHIAPKLDQHASCELNRMKNPICPRLGAACDFFVADEDMLEVAQWVVGNTPFDRLYFYGKDKPIHVSIGPDKKGEIVLMKQGKVRLIPSVIKKNKFLEIKELA